ncbi:MAG: erythromycin esterase family protein [Rhodanobacteraceae bacterium]|nr:erythromycin esterase family protein [Rhodanobacteraceae bacterium]
MLIFLGLLVFVTAGQPAFAKKNAAGGLEAAVADLCDRKVILLGEDATHSGGQTLEVKARLVQRLVDECGFKAVLFESQIYDFLDLHRSFRQGTAQQAQVAAAIGGLWSDSAQAEALVAFLFDRARNGRVHLQGLDPQVGGRTQTYTREKLAAQLASVLEEPTRRSCESTLHRHFNWQYDDATPYDASEQAQLLKCGQDILRRSTETSDTDGITHWMAENLVEYLHLSADQSPAASFNRRDQAMFRNLVRHLERLPRRSKVIVWCATIHAAKTLQGVRDGIVPFGFLVARKYGKYAHSVGFSAATGSFGRPGKPSVELLQAAADSLEVRSRATDAAELVYLDQAALRTLSPTTARLLDYNKVDFADWASLLDSAIVLREEQPHAIPSARRSATSRPLK